MTPRAHRQHVAPQQLDFGAAYRAMTREERIAYCHKVLRACKRHGNSFYVRWAEQALLIETEGIQDAAEAEDMDYTQLVAVLKKMDAHMKAARGG